MSDKPAPSLFIDYPPHEAVAVGDLLCFQGHWRKVLSIDSGGDYSVKVQLEPSESVSWNPSWNDFPLARIAWPLLDALKQRDPYR